MDRYPIHDTSEGVNHEQIVSGYFTYNPIPEGSECVIIFKNVKIKAKIDMNFYTNPNFSIIEILKVKKYESS